MNMAEANLTAGDGDLKVTFGGHTLAVDPSVSAHRPALIRFVGKKVVLGIRPEDMEDAALLPQAPEDRRLTASVSLLEALGSEVWVHFEIDAPVVLTEDVKELAVDVGADHLERLEKQAEVGRSVFTASLSPKTKAQKGGSIELVADSTRFHFFDPGTGLGIYD
jgi:multiple sugar transport system ATP-binding protein